MCAEHDTNKLCILVVDDTPDNLDVIRAMLESKGYGTSGARSGGEAIAELDRRCKAGSSCPDLVIIDIDLPDMRGGTLGMLIREQYPRLPFIYLTAYKHLPVFVDIAKVQDAPLLDKPVDLDALVKQIEETTRNFETRRVVGKEMSSSVPSLVRQHIDEVTKLREASNGK
jgi:CheY-like chemotaxis protein